jgi:hypothetical protein
MRKHLLVGLFALCGCVSESDWTAFVYPDLKDIPSASKVHNYTIGNFATFEQCQAAAIGRMRANFASTNRQGDYQCGYKCSQRKEMGNLLICKETRK